MSLRKIQVFTVSAAIPQDLGFLEKLTRNMWWCWNFDAIELFRRINPPAWRESGHNPMNFLSRVPQKRFEALVEDDGFMSHIQQVMDRFEAEVEHGRDGKVFVTPQRCIAYFSLEYGIHESTRLYSGGLGVLAGDHLKSASDNNLPLVGVGLLYRQGYLQQHLNNDGWQQEAYIDNEIHCLPLYPAQDTEGKPAYVEIPIPEGTLRALVWKMNIGRVPLYLLDTNIPENPPDLRKVTARLYGGDRRTRLLQELLLGIGGYDALVALGYDPAVCHMNEGHAAFVSLARIGHLCRNHKLDIKTAMEVTERTSVFTTHTPVAAGNETFPVDLISPCLERLQNHLNLEPRDVIAMGQPSNGTLQHELSMTILGMRMSRSINAVSKVHGNVARKMWAHLWPDKPEGEIPVLQITNGVHVPSWLSPDLTVLYDRYLGPEWRDEPANEHVLSGIDQISDEELWRAHEVSRSRLVRRVREQIEKQFVSRNVGRAELTQAKSILDQDSLTIGFARRFATYKRAVLILRDKQRLEALLTNPDKPVQIVFAGKAHPADDMGKDFIRQIAQFAKSANVRKRIVFIEDYDMRVARDMVHGVDVWLNTPRLPQEASGTSGMKAAINGVLHLSTLDGWWREGYSQDCGWTIGDGQEYGDHEYQDTVDALSLYNTLESEIVPAFYDRPAGDVPTRWTKMMKASIRMALGYFTSHRMTSEYNAMFYQPSLKRYDNLMADSSSMAKSMVAHRVRLSRLWKAVRLAMPVADRDVSLLHVGDKFAVTTRVVLGDLGPDEVDVEVCFGLVNPENEIARSRALPMELVTTESDGTRVYRQTISCDATGRYGFTTRITPRGTEWKDTMPGFITWADGGQS